MSSQMAVQMSEPELSLSSIDVKRKEKLQKDTTYVKLKNMQNRIHTYVKYNKMNDGHHCGGREEEPLGSVLFPGWENREQVVNCQYS